MIPCNLFPPDYLKAMKSPSDSSTESRTSADRTNQPSHSLMSPCLPSCIALPSSFTSIANRLRVALGAVFWVPALMLATARADDPDTAAALTDSLEAISEAVLADEGGGRNFNWTVANELRSFHAGRNEAKSVAFCDLILRHSIMDPYILDILSGWDESPCARTEALEQVLQRHGGCPFVRAAATLEMAGITQDQAIRQCLLGKVVSMEGADLEPYRVLARMFLSDGGADSR